MPVKKPKIILSEEKMQLEKIRQIDQEEEARAGTRLIRYGGDFKKIVFFAFSLFI